MSAFLPSIFDFFRKIQNCNAIDEQVRITSATT